MSTKSVFFAYEKGHQENLDAITKASKELNKKNNKKCKIIKWEDLNITGKIISTDIFDQIKTCDKFACDLTYLNHNVLFELGYAIAQQKRLKIFLNPNVIDAKKNYSELKILTNIGYKEFLNASDIVRELQKATLQEESLLLIEKLIPGYKSIEIENDVFLINLKNKNQAAIDLEEYLSVEYNKFITNNADDVAYRPLLWYLNTILKTKIVLLHMVGNNRVDFKATNAEFSLYAGLAYGLGKEVLMLAPEPYHAPIDYTDILIEYASSDDCVNKTLSWINKKLYKEDVLKVNVETNQQKDIEQRGLNLLKLWIGDCAAEEDGFTSFKTFVEIDAYTEAVKRKKAIITGRKGSGKTEIFMRLKDNMITQKNNINIIIKPDSDEMLSNIELSTLYHNDRSKKAFLTTVWQYVIFSKIFQHIYNNIDKLELSVNERNDIITYYENNNEMFNLNFYKMILYIAEKFQDCDITKDLSLLEKIKRKINPMTNIIHDYFQRTKYQTITILADNLDTGWEAKSDLGLQSLMIICLLEYIDELGIIFGDKTKIHSVIFLRKDIFNYILENSREPDKIITNSFEINWEKFPRLLKTVIDKRIQNILDGTEDIDRIWQDYFSLKSNSNPFEIIQSYIVKRPRDAIYFISRLFESAATNNKLQVVDEDFGYALNEYTEYLYKLLIAELKAEFPMIEKILNELKQVYVGILTQSILIPFDDFYRMIQKYLNKEKIDKFLKILMENNYLFAKIKNNHHYLNNYDDLLSATKERKFKFFRKNKILLNLKLIPFVEYSGKAP
jgi:nucleoside 2-deoxyribosyltransferase